MVFIHLCQQHNLVVYNKNFITDGSKYYIVANIKASSGNVRAFFGNTSIYIESNETGNYEIISGLITPTAATTSFRIVDFASRGSWAQVDVDYAYVFNISTLIANKQYSPLYNTTFDLMSDAQIKSQMDMFVDKPYLFIDYKTLGIDHLTVEQMDYWYEVYRDAKITPIGVNIEDYRSPLNGLTITWSENFGHAIDYSIEYNGEIYTYLGNTKKTVFVPIIVENTPDANFKIRVHKWSQGGVPIRIERVFVGLHLVYKQDKIFSFNKKKYNNVLGLELPQDQINFELSNLDRMFDPLWYNSYFKYLNEKTEIRAYSGFKYGENGEEWIKQGTYYLTDWKAPNNSITATFTARDILNLLDADEMYSKDTPLTLDEYCDIILGRDYKGVDDYSPYDLPVNPDGSKKWNIRKKPCSA